MGFRIPDELVERLQKGDNILREEILPLFDDYEEWLEGAASDNYQTRQGTEKDIRLALLAWKDSLSARLREIDNPCTLRIFQSGSFIRLLTDEEAAEYNRQYVRSGFRKARRGHQRQLEVDVSNLPDEDQIAAHKASIAQHAAAIAAADAELRRHRPEPKPHTATNPGIGNLKAIKEYINA